MHRRERLLQALTETKPRNGFTVTGKTGSLGFGLEGGGAISLNFNGWLRMNHFDFGSITCLTIALANAFSDLLCVKQNFTFEYNLSLHHF
ncbi:hypothetical protein H6G17_12975 [Chroococcidiopsis sp. FACHB-1243]|uniref:hypothetical protein n=1 Tax=Chroococcidiopsis sp. [FACHB-1243] TaxID=2692781 RepID=UPI0017831C7C|nr:hypothetical protein [Chroococcidiopsis sp. [FACHB-1243]]MBD2306424.1 hypothetical protein [Chroococcidiopsis sp. [FACHB-1243]]